MEIINRWIEIDGEQQYIEISCKITHYLVVPPWSGSKYSCPSEDDYYGHVNLEYQIVDTKNVDRRWRRDQYSTRDYARARE